jgi:stromal membrane-associated protein
MTESDQAKFKKRWVDMFKKPANQFCVDCNKTGPRWASANLGVFVCIECSGIHRNLGVHISFVRSVTLDYWTELQVTNMETWGNGTANDYYEANVPSHVRKPNEGDSVKTKEKYIRDKYEHKRYVAAFLPSPPLDEQPTTLFCTSLLDFLDDD